VLQIDRHGDERGFFSETYHQHRLEEVGIHVDFVQDNHSYSQARQTLRGLHLQAPPYAQAKLVRVPRGRILDVCVDARRGSPYYGQWVSAEISAQAWNQIFVPVGFLHGFMTLEADTEVLYKVSNYYHAESERGVIWNDTDLQIDWGSQIDPILSAKDLLHPTFLNFQSPFVY